MEVLDADAGKTKIKIGEKEFVFGEKEEEISVAKVYIPRRDFSTKEIKAPISGRVSDLFVKEGDFVKKDQRVLVLSSMKMENEIVAEFEGKVKTIPVQKGQEVKGGDILIVLS